jgi:tRNA dimethylallyltransferase
MICVVGPTAAGKSAFALEVAERFGGEIISCDSMAVYRGLDIGTDKPSRQDRARAPHHLIDVAELGSTFSAGTFREAALEAQRDILARGRLPVIVGGTGLYYRAFTQGLVEAPPRQEALRRRLKTRIEARGPERLHKVLSRLDPAYASQIGPRDALRIVRALEVRLATGRPLSEWIARRPFALPEGSRALRIGLTARREFLYDRIGKRVDAMMAAGLLEEVRGLWERGLLQGPVRKAIGYGELARHLEGFLGLDEAVEAVRLRSRHLAKRQMAWFNKEKEIDWFTIEKEAWQNDAIQFIQRWLSEARRYP